MLTFNNITADSFAQDTQQGAGRRRPRCREALSCSQCRERKVRCDRKQPCKQCQTRGHTSSCLYTSSRDATITNANEAGASQNGNHPRDQQRSVHTEPSSPLSSVSAESEMRKRLDRLELLLATNSATNSQPPAANNKTTSANNNKNNKNNNNNNSDGYDETRYRGFTSSSSSSTSLPTRNALQYPRGPLLSTKTRFIAGTHWLAACNNMTVLKAMLNKSSEFENSRKSFAEIKKWSKSMNAVSVPYGLPCSDAMSLFNLLPPRSNCEAWVRTYCQTYRHVYDIVDELTLDSSMEQVWTGPANNDDPTMICIVILLVCIGMQSEESDRLNGRRLARHVEQFAFTSDLLQKPCIGSMKVLLLLMLLKTIACSDTESLDSMSGIMGLTTQVALAMGLHRNPSAFGNIRSYHSEIRKRLWSVYFRLSFEHCMRTGIPLALQPEDTDVGYPANVNLADLDMGAGPEAESKELPVQTDATFSIIAARLAGIAAPYQRAICSAGSSVSPDAVKQLRDDYHDLLTEAPMYMRPGTKTANTAEEIQQAFLTIGMHSTSLILSLNFVINSPGDSVQKHHLLTVWDHSLSVLQSFQLLSQKGRHIQTLAYQLLWSDACRAAFSAGMVLNRMRILDARSIMATRLQHTLIPFQESLVRYLTFMSRFWFQSAHLGPTAAKNCLLLAVVVAVTSRLFNEDSDVSEKELLEVGARSVEQTVDHMKVAMQRCHSFPLSPQPSISSAASHSTRMIGDSGRSVSSPNLAESWPSTTSMMAHSHPSNSIMMDSFATSVGTIFGQSFVTPDPSSLAWTPQDMQWSVDPFEYGVHSASMSPISHVPSRQATGPSYVDGLMSPPIGDWTGTSQWVDDVRINF